MRITPARYKTNQHKIVNNKAGKLYPYPMITMTPQSLKPNGHECKQEDTITWIVKEQTDLKKEHKDLKKEINDKLDAIMQEVRKGDDKTIQYILMVVGIFLGAIMTMVGILLTFIRA